MKVGDFEIEINSVRTEGGWKSEGILPDGKRVISAPSTTREDAENDVKQQAEARLFTQRRYDVNRPFESVDDEQANWKEISSEPYPDPQGPMVDLAVAETGLTIHELRQIWWKHAAVQFNWRDFCELIATRQLDPLELIESMNIDERKLSAETRSHLPKGAFALPGRRYPIEDKPHARNALARVSQHGSPSEKAKVRSAVHRKYPEIGEADEAIVMHQADRLLDEVASSEYVPPHSSFGDDETEIENAARSGFTAWEYAHRRNRQHPKLEKAVSGGPYEPLYRRHFKLKQRDSFYEANFLSPDEKMAIKTGRKRRAMPAPKASFYPSDGGSAGGGGGVTSV